MHFLLLLTGFLALNTCKQASFCRSYLKVKDLVFNLIRYTRMNCISRQKKNLKSTKIIKRSLNNSVLRYKDSKLNSTISTWSQSHFFKYCIFLATSLRKDKWEHFLILLWHSLSFCSSLLACSSERLSNLYKLHFLTSLDFYFSF